MERGEDQMAFEGHDGMRVTGADVRAVARDPSGLRTPRGLPASNGLNAPDDLRSLTAGAGGALQSHEEGAALDRVFTTCQNAIAMPGCTTEELLENVLDAIRANELFVIADGRDGLEVTASPSRDVYRVPADASVRFEAGTVTGGEPSRRLAVAVGATSRALSGAVGRGEPSGEIILAGWADGPALTPASMSIVARTVSTARTAFQDRRRAVTSLFDQERTRLAYALHDDLTQTVTGAVLELEALAERIARDPREAISMLDTAKGEIRRALAELRAMLFDLSQTGEERQQQAAPLARYVQDVVKRWRLPARVAVEGNLTRVSPRVLSVAYTVIREALTNAAKHSAATDVTVSIIANDRQLAVTVGDAGRGFTPQEEQTARQAHHFGLDMLRKRAQEIGGAVEIESRPGKGTRVIAQLPIDGGAP